MVIELKENETLEIGKTYYAKKDFYTTPVKNHIGNSLFILAKTILVLDNIKISKTWNKQRKAIGQVYSYTFTIIEFPILPSTSNKFREAGKVVFCSFFDDFIKNYFTHFIPQKQILTDLIKELQ
jgi:hypothetical protein